jgi:CHAT domain-containing protein
MKRLLPWLALPLVTVPFAFQACGHPSQRSRFPSSSPILQTRVAAAGVPRPFELRLSGGFGHVRCDPVPNASDLIPRTGCAASPQALRKTVEILSSAGREVRRLAKLPRLRSEAFLLLFQAEKPAALEQGVEKLEQATDEKPGDAGILNDLGVALYLRAQQRQQPLDLIQALTVLDRAVDADGDLLEARFNRARTLQRLSLAADAREAWRDYLQRETDPAWRSEAAHDLETLNAASQVPTAQDASGLVGLSPQTARESAERDLLPQWADAFAAGRSTTADLALERARQIGAALTRETGETLLGESVKGIDSALESGDRNRLRSLSEGHRALAAGYRLYRQARTAEAVAELTRSRKLLTAAGSPAAAWASFFRACAVYQAERYTESLQSLSLLEESTKGRDYLSLEAHIAWMQGQNRMVEGRPLDALHFFRKAAAGFRAARETDNAATLASLVGQSLDYLGRHQEAWAELYAAMRAAPEIKDPKHLFVIYVSAADCVLWQGLPRTAIYFQNEVVRGAELSKNPQLQADSLFWRGLMKELAWTGLGNADFAAAHRVAALLADESARRRVGADLATVEGSLIPDPEQAIARLTPAIGFYERVRLRVQAASMAYQERARAFRKIGDERRAEADMLSGIEIAEERMRSGQPDEPRWALINRPGDLFEEMIALQVLKHGDKAAGFAFAERSLNRALPSFDPATVEPLSAAAVQKALYSDMTLVQYAVLDDRIFIWVISARRFDLFSVSMSRSRLRTTVERWRRSGWQAPAAGLDLYETLLRPWIGSVPAADLLVIVPGHDLEDMPFSALRDPRTGRYLVESHPLAVAPSATLYVAAAHTLSRPRGRGKALIVGNPAFDRREFPALSPLAEAEQEAVDVAHLFPGSRLLTGAAADRQAFLSNLPEASLIHFAGHAVANDASPELSMLLLAPGGGEGAVLARDLYRLDLRRMRLAVLSACRSGGGGKGSADLARAFLIAGVPTVVASLQRVEDRETAGLFTAFYHHLTLGEEPSEALRQAQISLLRGDDPALRRPASWAAFQIVGASRPIPQKGR